MAFLSDLAWERAKATLGGVLFTVGIEIVTWGLRALLGH